MSKIKNTPELDLHFGKKNIFLLNKDGEHFKLDSDDVHFGFENDLAILWDYTISQGSSKLNLSVSVNDQTCQGSFEIENEDDLSQYNPLSDLQSSASSFTYSVELSDIATEIEMNPMKDDFHLTSLEAQIKEIRQIDAYSFKVIFSGVKAIF